MEKYSKKEIHTHIYIYKYMKHFLIHPKPEANTIMKINYTSYKEQGRYNTEQLFFVKSKYQCTLCMGKWKSLKRKYFIGLYRNETTEKFKYQILFFFICTDSKIN